MIRFASQIFHGVREHFGRRDIAGIGLNFQIEVMDQRMRMLVSSESDGRIPE